MANKKEIVSFKKYIKIFWLFILSPFLILFLLLMTISWGFWGFMPSFEELENPKSNLASEVYSADGVLLGTFHIHNRTNVSFDELSPNIVNALIATEDIRFQNHSGVDVRSLFRVIVRNILGGQRSAGGGSTITQQLAKNLFPRQENLSKTKIAVIKLKEWVTAAKLERNYTKEEIIAMYLNTVDFGSHAFGVQIASRTYFDTSVDSLKIEEAAMLVGMLKAPSWFHPVRNPERATYRRNVVIYQMARYGFIEPEQFDSISAIPLDMSKYKIQDHRVGLATYFREQVRKELRSWSKDRLKPDGTPYNIDTDGLRIFTTIDSKLQRYAEEAVKEHLGQYLQPMFFQHWKGYPNAPYDVDLLPEDIQRLTQLSIRRSDRYIRMKKENISEDSIRLSFRTPTRMRIFSWNGEIDTIMTPLDSIKYYKHFLNTGIISVEPQTGHVKAYVGGIDYRHFMYDHVIVSKRQVGSTFKPFLYTLAMQEGGFSPCTKVPNVPVSFDLHDGTTWTPKNSSTRMEGEMVSLKWALANSVNYISAYLMKRYSPMAVIKLVRRMGITSHIDPVYAIALGSSDLSVFEMTGAMATYANKGVHVDPIFITRIEDQNGNLIESFTPKTNEAMSEETAYLMIELLKGVVESGTGLRLRFRYGLNYPIAGKTGTTQNNSDGWFIGLTPTLVTGVWVGAEDRAVRFREISLGQGANMALPIWALYMKRVYEDRNLQFPTHDFEKPLKPISVEVDCNKFKQDESPRDVFNQEGF
jgi:penicillin-binding protein 1A